MDTRDDPGTGYAVPTYEAPKGAAFYHFLHGNVPGHEIDFMYRPNMAEGPLSRQHFGHLSRLLMFIEPRGVGGSAFAIGNLSRDDSHYEPGHGGLAFILSLRIRGARDHAGRPAPSFSHAIAVIDRDFEAETLLEAALAFQGRVFAGTCPNAEDGGFYHVYARCAEDPARALDLVQRYTSDFADLQIPGPSTRGLRYSAASVTQPRRVVIVHEDGASFEDIARCAARIAAVLYQSDVKWTVISNGRESDLPGGVTVRILPASEAGVPEEGIAVHRLEDLPQAEEELARRLFRANPTRKPDAPNVRPEWREVAAAEACEAEKARAGAAEPDREDVADTVRTAPRRRGWMGLVGGVLVAVVGMGAVVMRGEPGAAVEEAPTGEVVVPAVEKAAAPQRVVAEEPVQRVSEDVGAGKVRGGAVATPVKSAGATRKAPRTPSKSSWKGGKPQSQRGGQTPEVPSVLGDDPLREKE